MFPQILVAATKIRLCQIIYFRVWILTQWEFSEFSLVNTNGVVSTERWKILSANRISFRGYGNDYFLSEYTQFILEAILHQV